MSDRFTEALRIEHELRTLLSRELHRELQVRGIGIQELATRLDILPAGAASLLKRETWTLDAAVRVADAIDMRVELRAIPLNH